MADSYKKPQEGVSMDREYSKSNGDLPAGLYRHPESGAEAIVLEDPLWGNTQAQAFARLGFKFVRPAEDGEIKSLPELAAEGRKAEEDSLKGLSARLDKLEGVAEENKSLTDEVTELRKQLEEEKAARAEAEKAAAKQAKQDKKDDKDAREQISAAGKATTSTAQEQSAQGAKSNADATTRARQENPNTSPNGSNGVTAGDTTNGTSSAGKGAQL